MLWVVVQCSDLFQSCRERVGIRGVESEGRGGLSLGREGRKE